MDAIKLQRTATDLKKQINFLIQRDFFVTYYGYKKHLIFLVILTVIVLAIFFLTPTKILVTLKAIFFFLTIFIWLVGATAIVTALIKRQNRIRWRDDTIKYFLNNEATYMMFDEQKITFLTNKFRTEINWEYFKYFVEYESSIFLIPEENIYEALYFSPNDIGHDNFTQLKGIIKPKLLPLDEK